MTTDAAETVSHLGYYERFGRGSAALSAAEQARLAEARTRTPRGRVEREILEAFDNDYEPDAQEVAAALVDEDVAAGEYEGCSSALELAYTEYEQIAKEVLG